MTVSNPEKYRKLVNQKVIYKESIVRGSKVKKLKEISEGLWYYVCEVDTSNPRIQELMTFLPERGIQYTLTTLPVIKPVELHKKIKEELDAIREIGVGSCS